jgi:hypothetical protein
MNRYPCFQRSVAELLSGWAIILGILLGPPRHPESPRHKPPEPRRSAPCCRHSAVVRSFRNSSFGFSRFCSCRMFVAAPCQGCAKRIAEVKFSEISVDLVEEHHHELVRRSSDRVPDVAHNRRHADETPGPLIPFHLFANGKTEVLVNTLRSPSLSLATRWRCSRNSGGGGHKRSFRLSG